MQSSLRSIFFIGCLFSQVSVFGDETVYKGEFSEYMAKQEYSEALYCCQKWLTEYPASTRAHYDIALAYMANQDTKSAIDTLELLLEIMKAGKGDGKVSMSAVCGRLAEFYVRQESYDNAIKLYEQILEANSKHSLIRYNLGFVHYRNRDYGRAIDYLTESLMTERKLGVTYTYLAACYIQKGKIREARDVLIEADHVDALDRNSEKTLRRLTNSGTLSGVVLNENLNSTEGAEIWVKYFDRNKTDDFNWKMNWRSESIKLAVTNTSGAFNASMCGGPHTLYIWKNDQLRKRFIDLDFDEIIARKRDVLFELPLAVGILHGVYNVSSGSKPARTVTSNLKLRHNSSVGEVVEDYGTCLTSGANEFSFTGLVPGRYTLRFETPSDDVLGSTNGTIAEKSFTFNQQENRIVNIGSLDNGGTIQGTVRLESKAVAGCIVSIRRQIGEEYELFNTISDTSGSYLFENLDHGRYVVYCAKEEDREVLAASKPLKVNLRKRRHVTRDIKLIIMNESASAAEHALEGKTILPFRLTTLEGKQVSVPNANSSLTVLIFWATWCGPCKGAKDEFERFLNESGADDISVVAISLDSDSETVVEYLKNRNRTTWNNSVIENGWKSEELHEFDVRSIPRLVAIDKQGVIISDSNGGSNAFYRKIDAYVKTLTLATERIPSRR